MTHNVHITTIQGEIDHYENYYYENDYCDKKYPHQCAVEGQHGCPHKKFIRSQIKTESRGCKNS